MRSANLMNIDYQHYYIFSGLIMRVDLICRWKATKIGYIQHCGVVVVINVGKHTKKILFLLAKLKDNFFDLFILLFTMLLTAKINRKTCIEMKDLGHVFFFCISLQITSFNIFNLEDKTNEQFVKEIEYPFLFNLRRFLYHQNYWSEKP